MRLIVLNGEPTKTGICKHPVAGPQPLRDNQVGADRQGNYEVHGGHDKAAYAYAAEDYGWWEEELGRELEPGTFGENLTVEGIDLGAARVGDRWKLGAATVEVSEPRIPCSKLAHKMEDPAFVKRFARALRPGAYLRIVEEGPIEAGDRIEVISRPDHEVTMELFCRAYFGERDLLPDLLAARALSDGWREWAEAKV
jgi:MOSC domain-containing protein YiiM